MKRGQGLGGNNFSMLKNFCIAIAGLLISLLLLELVVRLLLIPAGNSPKWDDRPEAYYRRKIIDPNEKGPGPKPQNAFRIAAVGDSITFGPFMQSDDVYAKKLERILNLNGTETKLEVWNYGVSGYSTAHEVNVVKQALVDKSDLILLQITLNDPELAPLDVQHENTVQRFGPFKPSPKIAKIISYWKTLGFILSRLHNTRTHYEYKKYFTELFENKESWEGFYNSLKRISELTRSENIPLAAVIFPLFGQSIDDSYSFKEAHKKIDKALDELGIPHLDLLNTFYNIPPQRLQVIPGVDFHPNEIGHRIAAENIYRFLKAEKLIPKEYIVENVTKFR